MRRWSVLAVSGLVCSSCFNPPEPPRLGEARQALGTPRRVIRNPAGSPQVATYILGTLGDRLILEGSDVAHANEPWVVDTDAGSASLLRDICPGQCFGLGIYAGAGTYDKFASMGGTGLFWGDDGAHGRELWRTDGTAAGTVLVKDLNPGMAASILGEVAATPPSTGWFVDQFGVGNGESLWKTDGTAGGTTQLKVLNQSDTISSLTPVGSSLYFIVASGGTNALWTSDGTTAGTAAVAGAPSPAGLASVNGTLFFWSSSQVWTASGTTATQLTDVGSGDSPYGFVGYNGLTWFASGSASAQALWRSDGTPAGTFPVFTQLGFPPGTAQLAASDGGLFIAPANAGGSLFSLWGSDGTDAGTRLLLRFNQPIEDLTGFGSGVLLSSGGAWFSDGTDAGTVQLTPQTQAGPAPFVVAGGRAWFERGGANPGAGLLFTTDGTPAGTHGVGGFTGLSANYVLQPMTPVNGALLGSINNQLWRTDGTDAGTFVLQSSFTSNQIVVAADDAGYYLAITGGNTLTLFGTDGTLAGTAPIASLSASAYATVLAASGGRVMLSAQVGSPFTQPAFVTADGGLTVVTINPGGSSNPRAAVTYQGRFYFLADSASAFGNTGFYTSDSTAAGTRLVAPVGADYLGTAFATELNGVLYFAGAGPALEELWRTDGTDAGTHQISALSPQGAQVSWLTAANGVLFFAAHGASGHELYRSDGTSAGTALVVDLNPGPADSNPTRLAEWNGRLVFLADDGTGQKIWLSDGTAQGTIAITDALTGYTPVAQLASAERIFAVPGGPILFPGGDALGNELWASYGTPQSTFRVMDLNPGVDSSNPSAFALLGGLAFFGAVDGTDGFVWTIPVERDGGLVLPPPDGGTGADGGSSGGPDSGAGSGGAPDGGGGPGTKGGCHCGAVDAAGGLLSLLLLGGLARRRNRGR